ncbi:MAG: TonB-dependent receptor [Chitinophagia bacterium]|nr:TonB-dependent receptor [Chitinophagia bacterium]
MLSRICLLTFHIFIFCAAATAQDRLSAQVRDAVTGKPVPGASITLGEGRAATDADGRFAIPCVGGALLRITHVGYEPLAISPTECRIEGDILLKTRETTLDAVELTYRKGRPLLYEPASVARLEARELNRGNGLFLDDAIQTNMPGVSMNRRSVGGGQQLNIRGYGNGTRGTRGPSSNFDGQGYKVYLNGIVVTDAEGITTFDDLDFASLGRVEVVKGPAGSLYGLAIAGAVNLGTIRPEKGATTVSQQLLAGNYGLRRATTRFSTAGEKSSLLLSYGDQRSDGFTIHNASDKRFVNVVAGFEPDEQRKVTAYFGYGDSYDERAGELTITQFERGDYSGNPEYIKRNAHSHVTTFRAGASWQEELKPWLSQTTSVFGTAFNSDVSSAGGWTDKGSLNAGFRSVFDVRLALGPGASLRGLTGVEAQRQISNTMGYSMRQHPSDNSATWVLGVNPYWVINAATSNVYTIAGTHSIFSEWVLGLPEDLSLTAGLGSSRQLLRLSDRFNPELPTRPAQFERRYSGMLSPRIAFNKVFDKRLSVHASWSRGYKPPMSSYFYVTVPAVASTPPLPATGRINEGLRPEEGSQWEVGTKGALADGGLDLELTLFRTVFLDKMTAVAVSSPISPNTTLYSYVVNGGRQVHLGIEASVRARLFEKGLGFVRSLSAFANHTLSDFRYGPGFTFQRSAVLTEDFSHRKVAAVARNTFNAGLDLVFAGGLYGNLVWNYRDPMPITSLNDNWTRAYHLLNVKLGLMRNAGRHLSFDASIGINNITNTQYFTMVFANQLPDAYVPAPRRANGFIDLVLRYRR